MKRKNWNENPVEGKTKFIDKIDRGMAFEIGRDWKLMFEGSDLTAHCGLKQL